MVIWKKTGENSAEEKREGEKIKLPLTASALWSLRRLGTSPRTSQWPTGT